MSKNHFLRGLRDGFPIGLGYFAVSFGLGISCRAANLTAFQGFWLSFLNNASAGEYGGITIIASDSGFLIMAAMMLVVNARYMLMSCALSQHLAPDTPLLHRLIIGYDLTDEIFGIAIAQPGYLNIWYYVGAMCAAMPGWRPYRARLHCRELSLRMARKRPAGAARAVRGHAHPAPDRRDLRCCRCAFPAKRRNH